MEPPVNYPQGETYQGKQIYGRQRGCAKFSCFGVVGALVVLVVIGIIIYTFAVPALMPNHISGSFLNAVIVPSKSGGEKVWILTDGSFNFIQTTKSPGRTSTGRECYFCKTWTYVVDPKTEKVISKIKTPYEDIITTIDMVYHNGKVWTITREYGENEPNIEAFDSETGEKVMDTKAFVAKFPQLSAGLTEAHYDKQDFTIRVKTRDGREGIYSFADGKLYKDFAEYNKVSDKDSTITSIAVLAPEDNSSSPRKKLMIAEGPKVNIESNRSSFEHFSGQEEHFEKYYKITVKPANEKIYLEGIIYYSDKDYAFIIYLDQLGKKSNRMLACIDLKTGKELWVADKDILFDEMKIDEEDDTFSSLFFTKDKISVKREGNLVLLTLQGEGIMGFDLSTGKKILEMDI